MLKIKLSRLWWACLVAIALAYPISALATDALIRVNAFPAPFLMSWTGVWVFAIAGGVCAAFVKMPEIDVRFHYPSLAKGVIGVFSGVALSLFIDTFTDTQSQALPLFALIAGLFSAPLVAGVMVWLSNQRRIDKALNQVTRQRTGVDMSLDSDFKVSTDYKKESSDDSANLS